MRIGTPPRTQLVIHFAPGTNPLPAVAELRAAGWDAWEHAAGRTVRRRETVVEAWTSRLRGEPLEVADAVVAQAREILADFVVVSIEAKVGRRIPKSLPAWQVRPHPDSLKADAKRVQEHAGGSLFYGERAAANRRAAKLLEDAALSPELWTVERYESWPQQMRSPKVAVSIGVTLLAALVGVVAGYVIGPHIRGVQALVWFSAWVSVAGIVLLVVAAAVQVRANRRSARTLALSILLLGIASLCCGATLMASIAGQSWVSSAAIGGVIAALLVQAMISAPAFARMRMSASRVPVVVVATAVGLTSFVLVLNVPLTLFYNAAGALQLVGTATWGVVIGTGFLFAGAVVVAFLAAWWAVAGWRTYATLFRPRLLFGLVVTGIFTFVAFVFLGQSISDGQLARVGAFGTEGQGEFVLPVCIAEPHTPAEHTPLWLLGTDGKTAVVVDRSRMTGRKTSNDFPHYIDANRALTYVDVDQGC